MEPKLLERGPIKLAGYSLKTTVKDGENLRAIPEFWSAFMTDGRAERLHQAPCLKSHDEYGVCLAGDSPDGGMEYLIGAELKEGAAVPAEFRQCEIPAARYAVFSSPPADGAGFSPAIQETWQYIFGQWLPQSEYRIDEAALSFELYDERCMSENAKVCDIYIPIVTGNK